MHIDVLIFQTCQIGIAPKGFYSDGSFSPKGFCSEGSLVQAFWGSSLIQNALIHLEWQHIWVNYPSEQRSAPIGAHYNAFGIKGMFSDVKAK